MKLNATYQKGFTLIELLFAMALGGITISVLMTTFYSALKSEKSLVKNIDRAENLSFLQNYICDEFQSSDYFVKSNADIGLAIVNEKLIGKNNYKKYRYITYGVIDGNLYRFASSDNKNKMEEFNIIKTRDRQKDVGLNLLAKNIKSIKLREKENEFEIEINFKNNKSIISILARRSSYE